MRELLPSAAIEAGAAVILMADVLSPMGEPSGESGREGHLNRLKDGARCAGNSGFSHFIFHGEQWHLDRFRHTGMLPLNSCSPFKNMPWVVVK